MTTIVSCTSVSSSTYFGQPSAHLEGDCFDNKKIVAMKCA